MTTQPAYIYRATVDHVVDGGTIALNVDLGFHIFMTGLCRLAGLNARELEAAGGPEARDHLRTILHPGDTVTVRSVSADKYAGRFDAVVYVDKPTGDLTSPNLNDQLVQAGRVGRHRRPACPAVAADRHAVRLSCGCLVTPDRSVVVRPCVRHLPGWTR